MSVNRILVSMGKVDVLLIVEDIWVKSTKKIFTPSDIELQYNREYTVSIVGVNCIGESNPLIISNITNATCNHPSCIAMIICGLSLSLSLSFWGDYKEHFQWIFKYEKINLTIGIATYLAIVSLMYNS